ncbi:Mu-like prophage tail protein gpP [Mesorhizobium albiziae]|uniref:Mu-like prophage tail protein gpP n=1 Tax=Neomesorhizobium albiziae TaxID=335020 RepID=A0A1I3YC20_9HYPH|nr:hypothetical protein [Mesorhizobium albiziae]GLS29962.1 hypothetical protein GCM10007937_16700 [Mesorhizobium albiziae]SFK29293.1 Mu-like prophage tail protein gpP [Mesorhizobium albiziae]
MTRDPLETLTVTIGGLAFSGWSEISIDYSVEQAARTASLTISDLGGAFPVEPGKECTVEASGDLVITGYVRDVAPSHDESSHSVSISVVSRTVDLVEASVDHPTGFVKKKSLDAIAKEFDTAGVGVEADQAFPIEPASFINPGRSWFYHMEPLARSHRAFIYDDENGKAQIAVRPRGRHAGALTIGTGGNIIAASAKLTERGRHDEVIVRGQSSRGSDSAALQPEGRSKDSSVRRRRPRIIVHESETTAQKLKERAEREIKRAAGFSREASITVSGWRDAGGMIFRPHYLISVADPRIYINQDMAIKSVRLTQAIPSGGPGTRAELTLCDPRALGGEAPAAGAGEASAAAWATPDVETSLSAPTT